MNPARKVRNVLRALKQTRGSFETKHQLWDNEYGTGRWDHCEYTPDAPVYSYVEKYCRVGSILDLGCGLGNTANELKADSYQQYTGVDVSEVALKRAAARSESSGRGKKNQFVKADIVSYIPTSKHDVILFRESIYYVPRHRIQRLLDHYMGYLSEDGVVIVNVGPSATKKPRAILTLIEHNYRIVEKYAPPEAREFIVVFN